jgi:hypothetical protein
MSWTVFYMISIVQIRFSSFLIHDFTKQFHQINILPFIKSVLYVSYPLHEKPNQSNGMIFHKQ